MYSGSSEIKWPALGSPNYKMTWMSVCAKSSPKLLRNKRTRYIGMETLIYIPSFVAPTGKPRCS